MLEEWVKIIWVVGWFPIFLLCIFGISVSSPERKEKPDYGMRTTGLVIAALFGAYLWPITTPIFLAWRAGHIVNKKLDERKSYENE